MWRSIPSGQRVGRLMPKKFEVEVFVNGQTMGHGHGRSAVSKSSGSEQPAIQLKRGMIPMYLKD